MNHQPPAHAAAPHAIEGAWAAVRLEYAGETAPDMVVEKTEIVFRNGNHTVRFGGETTFHGSYTLTENTLLIEGRRTPDDAPMTIRGIYQLTGNRLRICLGTDGTAPETFATKTGAPHYLGTYRRVA